MVSQNVFRTLCIKFVQQFAAIDFYVTISTVMAILLPLFLLLTCTDQKSVTGPTYTESKCRSWGIGVPENCLPDEDGDGQSDATLNELVDCDDAKESKRHIRCLIFPIDMAPMHCDRIFKIVHPIFITHTWRSK